MKRNSLYIISSLLFACILFVYATSINYQNNSNARTTKTETYTNTVLNVPIDIQYDSDQYFISGFSSEVTVFLTGSNRVTLASEMKESTRKFKVTADLTQATEGTIEVPLTIENLPSGLTAVATPQKITVKIGKKVTRENVPVIPQIDYSQIDDSIIVDSVIISNQRVSVTSDEDTLSKIDKIVAMLPTSERLTGNYSDSVPLQAVDKNGTVLPVVITPFETTMKVVTRPVKNTNSATTTTHSSTTSSDVNTDTSKKEQ
ncbi:CdaR family protein [Streptococcus sp. SM5]|uniref:CdaR family protein n=1 Tax=Streptococcus sp. SM5 TaxID=2898232 RepID=UPI0022B7AB72|nr:CdaR family protein [Streptococcus sp. SM5]